MKKIIIALGLVAVTLFGAAYVYAQNPGFCQGPPGTHPKGYGNLPPLPPEQMTKLQELDRKFREENAKLIGEIVSKRIELQSLWTDPKADPKAILDKEREMTELRNQLRDKVNQMRLEVRKFLTPEQIANWKPGWRMERGRMLAERGRRMGHKMADRGCMMIDRGRKMLDRGHMMGFGQGIGHGQCECQ